MQPNQSQDYLLELKEAESFRLKNNESDLIEARHLCTKLINRFPDYFGALLTLGLTELALRNYQVALGVLFRAVILNPRSWRANLALGSALMELKSIEVARHYIELAHKTQPDDSATLFGIVDLCLRSGDYEEAITYAQRAIDNDDFSDEPKLLLIKALVLSGQYEGAYRALKKLEKEGPRLINSLSEAMTLPDQYARELFMHISHKNIDSLKAKSFADETTIQYARAHKLHFEKRYVEAFNCLSVVNEKIFSNMSKEHETQFRKQEEMLNFIKTSRADEEIGSTEARSKLLLVLGPSRSGKSTLEGLLAGTSRVKVGYESTVIENCVKQTLNNSGMRQSSLLEVVPPSLNSEFLRNLDSEIGRLATSDMVYTITNPSRIFDAYRLLQTRSNTWVVFVQRDMLDNAMRIFMKRYLHANSYSYDIGATIRHIKWYNKMISVLHERFPDRTCIVNYEALIGDPLFQCRRVFQMIGVDPIHQSDLPATLRGDIGFGQPYKGIINELYSQGTLG
jgi:tetratricopeptide (TPR) repeat protein